MTLPSHTELSPQQIWQKQQDLWEKQKDMEAMVKEHDRIIKGTGEEPGICEQLRNIQGFVGGVKSWLKAIALLFLAQLMVFIFGLVALFVRVLPILMQIDKEGLKTFLQSIVRF